MANQVIVTNTGNVQVALTPPPNVQVQISRAAISTVTDVPTANYANYAGNSVNAVNVTGANQPNITNVGTLGNLNVSGNVTATTFYGNLIGNIVGNLVVPGSNTDVLFNTDGNADASINLQFNKDTNILSVVGNVSADYYIGNGSQLTGLPASYSNTNVQNYLNGHLNTSIIPASNVTYSLGNNTNRFNDLYLSGNTIYLGAQEISANATGISFTGNLTGNATGLSNIPGGNITGTVANAELANTANTVIDNLQPNITQVGTLSYLNATGTITSGQNTDGQVILTPLSDPNGGIKLGKQARTFGGTPYVEFHSSTVNLSYDSRIVASGGNGSVGGGNLDFIANSFTFSGNITGNISNANYATNAGTAFSVAVANVVGIGNIATVNLDGNVSNILTGAGTFVALPTVSANANYANFAGTAFNVSGSNVTGAVANATHATVADSANSVAGANVSGVVANATFATTSGSTNSVAGGNVVGAVGLATFATTANAVAGANVSGVVANATHATVSDSANAVAGGNVSGAVGLATFATTANSVAGANVVGEVANANYATFSGSTFSVAGANVSGFVANATHATISDSSNGVSGSNVVGQVGNALVSGTVYSNAQPNITSVGTLTSLAVTGNITGFANIAGDYILGNGAFLTGVGDFSAAEGYWGSFYSNVSQSANSNTAAFSVTLNNSDPDSYGVYISNNSRVNFTYAGTYNFQFSLQFLNTNGATVESSVWLNKNGNIVPDTRGAVAVTDKQAGVNGQIIAAWNYVLKLNAGDYLELIWQTENYTAVTIEYLPAGTTPTTPASPSAIVTAMQVTNVQAATLGGNLTANLIGNTFGLSGTSFVNIIGNISGNVFTGNASGLTGIVGGNVTGFVANASHANISDVANIAYSVSGANVSGTVANATFATTSGTTNSVAGANVVGAVGLATFATTANAVAGANVSGTVANATHATTSDSANSVAGANVSGAVGLATFATTANAVAGANVSGTVANATHATVSDSSNSVAGGNVSGAVGLATFATTANSVAVANVSGIGNIAVVNLDGSSSNVLYGNGVFATISIPSGTSISNGTSNVNIPAVNGNVNISSAGNPNIVVVTGTGANITGTLNVSGTTTLGNATTSNYFIGNLFGTANLATFATTANSVAGGNVSGQVANALVAGTVYSNSQPNITDVGNLTQLSVIGNINGNSSIFIGSGANATGLSNPTIIAKSTAATYVQAAVVNSTNTGSADWAAYGDNGSDTQAFVDMGFTGSAFNDANYTITKPNDGYVFAQGDTANTHGGNLVFATGNQGTTKDIVFATGGFLAANEKMRFINSTGQFDIQTTTAATSNVTGALRVRGGIGVAGNIFSSSNITAVNGNVTGLNVSGVSNLNSVSNVIITGGTNGYVLSTNGSGNLSWVAQSGGGGGSSGYEQIFLMMGA
jgi:hypothetical protein